MRRRLVITIVGVAALAVGLFAVPLAVIVSRFVDEQAVVDLQRNAVLATRAIPRDFASTDDPVELPDDHPDGIEYALYDVAGTRLVGHGPATADGLVRQALDNSVADGEVGETLVVAVPVIDDEQVVGALRASQATTTIDARARRYLLVIAGIATTVLVVAAAIAYLLADRLTRPIRQLRDSTVQLGTGDFAITAPSSTIPEIDQTARALTTTAHRLDSMIERERAFSQDASHQLRTPLTAMRTTLEAELAFPRDDQTQVLTEVLGDIERLSRTVDELLAVARSAEPPEVIDLGPVLDELDRGWQPRYRAHGRDLSIDAARYAPPVVGHAVMLRHALDVLLDNALTHGRGRTTLDVSVETSHVSLTVSDEGPGIPAEAFSRSSTTSRGLALAGRLVTAQGGRIGPSPDARSARILLERRHGVTQ